MKGEFVNLLSLFPSAKEFLSRAHRKPHERSEDRRKPVPRTFNTWLQAYWIFSSVLEEKHPDRCSGLFQHLEIVLEAYKNFSGLGWF